MSDQSSAPSASRRGDPAADEAGLREQHAVARATAAAAPSHDVEPLARVESALRRAEQIEVGVAVPAYANLGTVRRAVAYASGRVLLYLLRLITVDQRLFNRLLRGAAADLHDAVARLGAEIATLRGELQRTPRLDEVERSVGEWGWHIKEIADTLAARDGRVVALEQSLTEQRRALDEAREAVAYLRRRLAERDARIDALLGEVGISQPTLAAAAAAAASAAPIVPAAIGTDATGAIDDIGFQDAFHGDEAAVRVWQQRYLAKFADCSDVLDIGCGRGEFLELLRDAGVTARGVDLSADSVLHCRAKQLDVIQVDALAYLAGLEDASLGGIFCAQVIEHLPAAAAVRLIQLAHAKLRPDGVLLVETLNPECLLVHYRWFWMDLTHVRLLHPETLKFLFLSTGFHSLEGQFQPAREPVPLLPPLALAGEEPGQRDAFNAATQHLNALLHGSPDYALIGRR